MLRSASRFFTHQHFKVAAAVNFCVVCCHIIIAAVVIADAATKKSVQAVVSLVAAVFFCVVCCSLGKNKLF